MIKLFFDIETIPVSDEQKDMYLEIQHKKFSNKEKNDDEIFKGSSFDGTFGQICCIGILKEDPDGKVIQKEVLSGTEQEILVRFWEIAKDVTRFIGHNIWSFDLPFIYKRSVIHGVKPRFDISFARYRNTPIFDTMVEWDLWNLGKGQKLDTLAKVFGFPSSKDEMDGSMVWQYYQDGRIEDICTYCMKDVELTRQVYYKLTFEEQPQNSN